jgi:hypothetical protein
MNEIEKKIEKLIEEAIMDKVKPVAKGAGLAALGGMVGAGLDVYFNGGKNLDDYVKPVLAWGLGSAVGGLNSVKSEKDKKIEKDEQENIETE